MNVKDYEYIVSIADQGSISKASQRLNITPGALSKYLQRLEADLGVPLFYRSGNQFLLTQIGERYVQTGRIILSLDEQLTHDIHDMIRAGGAAVRLGTPRGISPFVMELLLPKFYEVCKDRPLIYQRGSSLDLIRDLEDGKLDICLAYSSEQKPNLSYVKLAHVSMVLAVPVHSSLLSQVVREEGQANLCLYGDAWMDQPYISLTNQTYSGRVAEEFFQKKAKRPNSRVYVGDTSMALSAVENGVGNTLLLQLPHTDRQVHYLSLPELENTGMDVYAVTREGEAPCESIQTIIRIAREHYQEVDG